MKDKKRGFFRSIFRGLNLLRLIILNLIFFILLFLFIEGIYKDVAAALFLDKFVIFSGNYIQRNHFEYLFDRINFSEKIKKYYQERSKASFDIKQGFELDNCGNLNYPLEEYYLRSREAKGG